MAKGRRSGKVLSYDHKGLKISLKFYVTQSCPPVPPRWSLQAPDQSSFALKQRLYQQQESSKHQAAVTMTSKTTLLFFVFLLLSITSPTTLKPRAPQSNCGTCAPNPIASIYPSNITGTINATTLVIIVPLTYAR